MKSIINVFFILSVLLTLTACVEKNEIEDTGIINALGIDLEDDGEIMATMVIFQFTEQSDKLTKMISGKGKSVQGALDNAEKSSLYKFVPGKIKITVFSKELAEKGIFPLLDMQARNPTVPDLMYLAIVDPTVDEIFNADEDKISADIGQFLHSVIKQQASDHNIPRKTLQDFFRIYYDIGQDNVIPIFEMIEGIPKQTKNALFKNDQAVGELTNEEVTFINLMDVTVKKHEMEITLPLKPFKSFIEDKQKGKDLGEELHLSIVISKGKSKTKITDIDSLTFATHTKIKIQLIEQTASLTLNNYEVIRLLEQEIEKYFEEHFERTLKKVKKYKADPFGYGKHYKMTRKGNKLTDEEWYEKLSDIQVDFNVDVTIQQYGAIN